VGVLCGWVGMAREKVKVGVFGIDEGRMRADGKWAKSNRGEEVRRWG